MSRQGYDDAEIYRIPQRKDRIYSLGFGNIYLSDRKEKTHRNTSESYRNTLRETKKSKDEYI